MNITEQFRITMQRLHWVFDTFEIIKGTSGNLQKAAIFKQALQHPNGDLMLMVIRYALSSHLKFNIKAFPKYKQIKAQTSVKKIFKFLDYLDEKGSATNEDKQKFINLISGDEKVYQLMTAVCSKKLRMGMAAKSVNKIAPGTIYLQPYMRCSPQKEVDKRINFTQPVLSQEKADGMFVNIHLSPDGVILKSRDGKIIHQLKRLKKALVRPTNLDKYYGVLHGELLIVGASKRVLPRKTGNGILNQCIQQKADQNQADRAIVKLWDIVPDKEYWSGGYSTLNNYQRYEKIIQYVSEVNSARVHAIQCKTVFSKQEALEHYEQLRKQGKEGTVLKNTAGKWKDHTSPDCCKMKNVSDCDVEITGFNYGTGKFKNKVGAILYKSACGRLTGKVGTGLADDLRSPAFIKSQVGKIMTLNFESVIKNKNKEEYSLFLPVFVEIREDKSEADTLEKIQSS